MRRHRFLVYPRNLKNQFSNSFRLTAVLFPLFFGLLAADAQYPFTNGLIAYYPFNGNANDESGNDRGCANNGASLTSDRFGGVDGAYHFDGSSSIMIETNRADTFELGDAFTMSCWVNVPSLGPTYSLVRKEGDAVMVINGDPGTHFYIEAFRYGRQYRAFSDAPPTGTWCMLSATWDRGTFRQYINAQSRPREEDNTSLAVPSAPLTLGGSPIYGQSLLGALDDVRVYNRALPAEEIQQLYEYERNQLPHNPVIISVTPPHDEVTLTWNSVANETYRVEYRTNLSTTNWTALTPNITATGGTASFTDSSPGNALRYYRVMIINSSVVLMNPTSDARIATFGGPPEGKTIYLSVYNSSGNVQRTLLHFDLSALGADRVIAKAILKLYADANLYPTGNPSGQTMDVYRVIQPWTEAEVSWFNQTTSSPWLTAGGDYVGVTELADIAPYASNSAVVPENYFQLSPLELNWDVTALVQEWYAGTKPNYGLMLLSYPGSGLHFHSRESGPNIPELEVQMVDGAQVPPIIPTVNRSSANVNLTWSSLPGRIYQVEYKASLTATDWVVLASNITAVSRTASLTDNPGIAAERFYRVSMLP